MLTRRWLTSALVGLLTANAAWAQNVTLIEAPLAQQCVRNDLTTELKGTQSVKQNGKETKYPLEVHARHDYLERYLTANGAVSDKAARCYATAESVIRFNDGEDFKTGVRPKQRSLMVAQRLDEQIVCFSPKGMLTREEIELLDHFDTLSVSGLLPGKDVPVGASWKISNSVVSSLCALRLTNHSVEGKLVWVKDSLAHVELVGTVQGIDMGAQVGMVIKGQLEFDVVRKRIVSVEWLQKDDRQQGPISPAMNAEVTIKLKRIPIEMPPELNQFALVPIPTTAVPPGNLTNIEHQDAQKRFKFQYARDWCVTIERPQLVMRLMERGALIAQVTITPWKKVAVKNVMSKEDFADLMEKSPGWEVEKTEKIEEIKVRPQGNHKAYRVVASGDLDGRKTWQYFYLIVSPQGEQLIVTFSMLPEEVQRLGARDMELVREIVFPEAADNANSPAPK